MKNGQESKEYDHIAGLTYSPNGMYFSFSAKKDGKSFIVKDGVELSKYDYISYLKYSNNGNKIAYKAKKDGKILKIG